MYSKVNQSYAKWKSLSRVRLFATPWTTQSTEFSRPEFWSGQPFPSPGDLPNPGMEPRSPAFFPIWATSYTYACISLYAFLDPFPLYVIGEYSLEFPVLPRRSLLSSVSHTAMCTHQSQSPGFPSPTLPLVNPNFVFYIRVSISVVSSQMNAGAFLMKWHGDHLLGFLFVCLFVCFYYNRDE